MDMNDHASPSWCGRFARPRHLQPRVNIRSDRSHIASDGHIDIKKQIGASPETDEHTDEQPQIGFHLERRARKL